MAEIPALRMGREEKILIDQCTTTQAAPYTHYLTLPSGVTWGDVDALLVVERDDNNYFSALYKSGSDLLSSSTYGEVTESGIADSANILSGSGHIQATYIKKSIVILK